MQVLLQTLIGFCTFLITSYQSYFYSFLFSPSYQSFGDILTYEFLGYSLIDRLYFSPSDARQIGSEDIEKVILSTLR